jgi:hypothetical protein
MTLTLTTQEGKQLLTWHYGDEYPELVGLAIYLAHKMLDQIEEMDTLLMNQHLSSPDLLSEEARALFHAGA